MVLWACSSKRGEFHFTVTGLPVAGFSRVRVEVTVSVMIRVRFSFIDRDGIGHPDME